MKEFASLGRRRHIRRGGIGISYPRAILAWFGSKTRCRQRQKVVLWSGGYFEGRGKKRTGVGVVVHTAGGASEVGVRMGVLDGMEAIVVVHTSYRFSFSLRTVFFSLGFVFTSYVFFFQGFIFKVFIF